jgi:CMP/dCMP kinase
VIIAIDGPAGSGKSTTAKAVARELGFRHLDSGAFYRALTYAALRSGTPPEAWGRFTRPQLDELGVAATPEGSGYAFTVGGAAVHAELRAAEVNARVSIMAAVPAVRDWLLGQLRGAAAGVDLVADGRDIGTVVFPEAELKVFLVADPRERARRRLRQQSGDSPPAEEVEAEISRLAVRDRLDSERVTAPLRKAEDAVEIDTSRMRFQDQVARIVALAQSRRR